MKKFITQSTQETEQVGHALAQKLSPGAVIALFGNLGAGKTAFVRGLAKGLAVAEDICSPTYAIVHDYGKLVHFDMYRIHCADDLESTGWYDYLGQSCVIAVEWSENITGELPGDAIHVQLRPGKNEDEREIVIDYTWD